jgi:hypothetical protein
MAIFIISIVALLAALSLNLWSRLLHVKKAHKEQCDTSMRLQLEISDVQRQLDKSIVQCADAIKTCIKQRNFIRTYDSKFYMFYAAERKRVLSYFPKEEKDNYLIND